MTGPRVSVVVPVYNPGRDIDRLIDSLGRQSLPPDAFEAILVDDGSTDGTGARLDALAAERPNVQVIHIPNSGWPGRPRNVGMDAASGEFIQFVDCDDYLGDEALERLTAFARDNAADIAVGKVVSDFRGVADALFRVDRPRCTIHDAPLVSTLTVHKLFRTSFLREHGIRFVEGRRRLEDQLFTLAAYLATDRIAVLASYPCYYYMRRRDSRHIAAIEIDPPGYYDSVRQVLGILDAGTEPGPARDNLRRRWYRNEILSRLSEPTIHRYTPELRHRLFEAVRETERDVMSPAIVAGLGAMQRARARLLQDGREADLLELATRASRIVAAVSIREVRWQGERLRISLEARFQDAESREPVVLARSPEGLRLDPALLAGLVDDPIAIDEAVDALKVTGVLRDSVTSIEWPMHQSTVLELVPTGQTSPAGPTVIPVGLAVLTVDPLVAAGGRRLPPGSWQLVLRLSGLGLSRAVAALERSAGLGSSWPAILGSPAFAARALLDDASQLRLDVDSTDRGLEPRTPRPGALIQLAVVAGARRAFRALPKGAQRFVRAAARRRRRAHRRAPRRGRG
ncbi:MAG TPA: glycosyltransferase [Candidatus Limnocylindrales bacterium]|nr:glycosyltransferase [Candidatus Limnocylindrales bacterium]